MSEEYRIYEFRSPGPNWKDLLFKVVGIGLLVLFAWMLVAGTAATLSLLSKNLFTIPIFIISLVLHEMAHAYMADFLGDPTPRASGRLSFNPMRHLDLWGTLLFIFCGFGWAKPVSVNPNYFRDPKRAMASVAMAGPVSNLLIGFVAVLLLKIYVSIFGVQSSMFPILEIVSVNFLYINVMLALFNLIPFPPLDGSRLIHYILPARYKAKYYELQRYSMLIFLFIFLFAGSLISPAVKVLSFGVWNLFF